MNTEPQLGGTVAVVPIKSFARAKSRLASGLDAEERHALARRCAEHVLGVLCPHPALDGVLICGDGQEVREVARRHGATILPDPEGAVRLNEIVDAGLSLLAERGVLRVLVIMADLPDLSREDVDAILGELDEETPFVLAPDRARRGTNALAMSPPDRIPTCFGDADSLALHRERAARLGLAATLIERPGFARDIDRLEDLDPPLADGT